MVRIITVIAMTEAAYMKQKLETESVHQPEDTSNPWTKGFKDESLLKAAEFDDRGVKVQLPKIGEVVTVTVKGDVYPVLNKAFPNGKANFMDVEWKGLKGSLLVPETLRFSIATQLTRESWGSPIGKTFHITAEAGSGILKGKNAYRAQLAGDVSPAEGE